MLVWDACPLHWPESGEKKVHWRSIGIDGIDTGHRKVHGILPDYGRWTINSVVTFPP